MTLDWIILFVICMICAVSAVKWLGRRPAKVYEPGVPELSSVVYFFADGDLIDASSGAPELPDGDVLSNDWQRLRDMIADRFPNFPDSYERMQLRGHTIDHAVPPGDTGTLVGEWIDGIARVELRDQPQPQGQFLPPTAELETLRMAVDQAPYPIWRVEDDGHVGWHNKAYEEVYENIRKSKPDPAHPMFIPSQESRHSGQLRRVSVAAPDTETAHWFDVSSVRQDGYLLFYATDVSAVVDAETAQRNFVQTLAKTFAQLSIGLAVFDRNRQLVLFNPALIDLTSLSADFLSGRPNLFSFFDRLRDSQMMPEPKNYGGWRKQMSNLVEAAADGRYQETWSLPSGSVYSVNGRPHPDGAVAFLFEDITAEVTLTRRFRSDLELGHSILDNLNDAIVVFGPDGILTLCNSAYCDLWKADPDSSFADVSILDATRNWQEQCDATPVWGDVRDFVINREDRAEWWARVHLKSGKALICAVHPVQSGATMVCFSQPAAQMGTKSKQSQLSDSG